MNAHFISIKVDREEHPHIDQIYMDALQLMGQSGGWPLNVFCTTERIPVYGGTYFPKHAWLNVLSELNKSWRTEKSRIDTFAARIRSAFSDVYNQEKYPLDSKDFSWPKIMASWQKSWDWQYGGFGQAPKFVMPPCWMFLVEWCNSTQDAQASQFLHFSLHQILRGGIYDHVGGGICRYSVDREWHIPHFEKMLYDNAQILSLLAVVSRRHTSALYDYAMNGIVEWLENHLRKDQRTFAAAMDADSEGEEGKYYCWSERDLDQIDETARELLHRYFDYGEHTKWEDGKHVLRLSKDLNEKFNSQDLIRINQELLHLRRQRKEPAIDSKAILSWNAMLIVAFCDLAILKLDTSYLDKAVGIAEQLFGSEDAILRIAYNNGSTVTALHEDYALAISASLKLHQTTGELKWLNKALQFTYRQEELFLDDDGLFFMSHSSTDLFQRKKDLQDGVISSSNSIQANNYYQLGLITGDKKWTNKARKMLEQILTHDTSVYGSANWLRLLLRVQQPQITVVLAPNYNIEDLLILQRDYHCVQTISRSTSGSSFPAHEGRKEANGAIYVCTDTYCEKPVFTIQDAQQQLKKWQKQESPDAF